MQCRFTGDELTATLIDVARGQLVSNTVFVVQTRGYMAERLPERKQRNCALTKQLDTDAPEMHVELDRLKSVVRTQNDCQIRR